MHSMATTGQLINDKRRPNCRGHAKRTSPNVTHNGKEDIFVITDPVYHIITNHYRDAHIGISTCRYLPSPTGTVVSIRILITNIIQSMQRIHGSKIKQLSTHGNQPNTHLGEGIIFADQFIFMTWDLSVYQASWIVRLWSLRFSHKGN